MAAANDSCGDPLTARSSTLSLAYHDRDGLWRLLEGGFFRRMPLPRAEWTVPSSGKAFVLPPLTVLAQPISDPAFAFPPLPVNWYREPFLHVFLVRCESTDDYRRRVRPAVKAFADDMAARGAEWLVVYAPVGTREGMLGKVGQLMASALSEISGNKLQVKGGSTLSSRVYRSVHESLKADVGGRRHGHRILRLDAWEGWRREEQAAARRRASAAAARASAAAVQQGGGGSGGSSGDQCDAGAYPSPSPPEQPLPSSVAAGDDGSAPASGGNRSTASKLFGALKRQASGGSGAGGVFSRKSREGGDAAPAGPLTLKLNPAGGGSGPVIEFHRGKGAGSHAAAAPGSATFSSGGSASSSSSSSSLTPSFAAGVGIRDDGNVDEPLPPLEPADAEEIDAQWDALIAAVRGCALDALTARVSAYDAEVAKLYDQRYVPGWNFCAYFAVAESLAFVYSQVRLPGQALAVYEAIENTFLLVSAPPSGPALAAITVQLTRSGGGSDAGRASSRRTLADAATGVRSSSSSSSSSSASLSGSGSSEGSSDGGSGPGRPGGAAAEPPARRRPSLQQSAYAGGDGGSSGSGYDVVAHLHGARASSGGGYNALYPLLQSLRTVAGIGETPMLAPYPPALLAELTRVEADTGAGAVTAAATPPSPPSARGGGRQQQHPPPAPVHPPSYSAAVDHTSDAWYIAAAAAGLAGGVVGGGVGGGSGGTIGRCSGAGGGGGGTIGRNVYGSMSGGGGTGARGSAAGLAGIFQRGHSSADAGHHQHHQHHGPPPQQSGSSAATAAAIAAYRQAAGRSGSVSGSGDGSIGAGASWGRGGGLQRPALPPSLRPFPYGGHVNPPPPQLPSLARPPPHVFDVSRKPYRALLYGSHISLFDLRHYLFARQAALLLMGRRTQDLADRAAAFVRLAVDMATVSVAVGAVHPHTACAWIFAAAMDVVEVCTRRRPQAPAATQHREQHQQSSTAGAPRRRSLTASPPKPQLPSQPAAAAATGEAVQTGQHEAHQSQSPAAPSATATADGFARSHTPPAPPAPSSAPSQTSPAAAAHMPAPPPPLTHRVTTIGEGADEDADGAPAVAPGGGVADDGAASVSSEGSDDDADVTDGGGGDSDSGSDGGDVSSISTSSSVAAGDHAAALGGTGSDDATGSTGTGPSGLGSPVPSVPGTPALHAAAAAAAGAGFSAFGGAGAGPADLSLESTVDGGAPMAAVASSGKRVRRPRRSGDGGRAGRSGNATAPLVPHLQPYALSGDAMELNEQAPAAVSGRSGGSVGGGESGEAVPVRPGSASLARGVDDDDDADEAAGMAVPKERYDYRHASVSSRADGGGGASPPPPPGADSSGRGTPTAPGGVSSMGSVGRSTAGAVAALLRQRTGSSARASPTPLEGAPAVAGQPPQLMVSASSTVAMPAPMARGPSPQQPPPPPLLPASSSGAASGGVGSSSSSASADGHPGSLPPHPPLSARSVRSDTGTPATETPQPSPSQAPVQLPPVMAPAPMLAPGVPLTPHPPTQPHPSHATQQPSAAAQSSQSASATTAATVSATAYSPQPPHPLALQLSFLVETARTQLVALVADVLGHDVNAPPSAGAVDSPDELLALLRPRRPSLAAQLASSHAPLAAPRSPTTSLRWSRGVVGSGGADAASSGGGAPFAQAVSPFELAASVATAAAAAAAAEGASSSSRDAHSASGLALAAALSTQVPTPTASPTATSGSTPQPRPPHQHQLGYHADRLFASLCYLGGYVAVRSGTPRRAATLDLQRAALLLRHGEPAAALSILAYHAPRLAREGWSGGYGWAAVLSAAAQWALGPRHAGEFCRSALALCDPRTAPWVLPAWAATVARPTVLAPSLSSAASPQELSAALLVRGGLSVAAASDALRFLRRVLAAALRVPLADGDDDGGASPSSASTVDDDDESDAFHLLPPGELAMLQRQLSRATAAAAAMQGASAQSLSLPSSPASSAAPAAPSTATPLESVLTRVLWSPSLLPASPASSSSADGSPPLPLAAVGSAPPPPFAASPGTTHSPLAALVGALQWAAMAGYYVARVTAAAQAHAELREAARAAQAAAVAAAGAGGQRHGHGGSPVGGSGGGSAMYRRRTASRVVLPTAATLAHAASASDGSSSPPPLVHYRELTLSCDGSGPAQQQQHQQHHHTHHHGHHGHHRHRPSGSPPPPHSQPGTATGAGAVAATPYAKRHVTLPADTPAAGHASGSGGGGSSPTKESTAAHNPPGASSTHFHYGQWQPMRPLLSSAVTLCGPAPPQLVVRAPRADAGADADADSVPLAALRALLTPRPVVRGQSLSVEVALACALPCGLTVAAVEVGLEPVAATAPTGSGASPAPANLHAIDPATLPVDPHAWVPLGPPRGAPPAHLTTLPGVAQAAAASHGGWARPLVGSDGGGVSDASSHHHQHRGHGPVVTFHSSAEYATAGWAASVNDASPSPSPGSEPAAAGTPPLSSLLVSTRTHAYRLRHTPAAGNEGSDKGADTPPATSAQLLRLRHGLTTVTLAATAPDVVATYRVASVRLVVVPGGLTLYELAPLVGVGYSLRQLVEAARLAEAAAAARTAADADAAAAAHDALVAKRTLGDGTLHVDPCVSGAEAYPTRRREGFQSAPSMVGAAPSPSSSAAAQPTLLSAGSVVRAALDQPASAWQRRSDAPSPGAAEVAAAGAGPSSSAGRAAGAVILDGYLSAHAAPAPPSVQASPPGTSVGGGIVSVAEFAAGAHPAPSQLSPGAALVAQLASLPAWAREAAADVAAARRLPVAGAQGFHAHQPPAWTRLLIGLRVAPPDAAAEDALLRLFRRAADARAAAARNAVSRQHDFEAMAAAEAAVRAGNSTGTGAAGAASDAAVPVDPSSSLLTSPVQSLSLHSFLLGGGGDAAAALPAEAASSLPPPRLRADSLLLPRSLLPLLLPAPHFPPGAGHGAGAGHSSQAPLLPLPPAPDGGGAPWGGAGVGDTHRQSLAYPRLPVDSDDDAAVSADVTDAGVDAPAAAHESRVPLASLPPHWFDVVGAALGCGGGGVASASLLPAAATAVSVSERPPPVHVWLRAPHPASTPIPLPPQLATPSPPTAPADVPLPLLYAAPSVLTALVTSGAGAGPGGLTGGKLTLTLPPGARSLGPALVAEAAPAAPAVPPGVSAGAPWVSLADPAAPFVPAAAAGAASYRSVPVSTALGPEGSSGTLSLSVPLVGDGASSLPHGRYLLVHVPVAFRQPHAAKAGAGKGGASGSQAPAAPGAISRQASAAASISGRQPSFRSVASAGSAGGGGSSKQLVAGGGGKLFPPDARFEPSPYPLLLPPAPAPPARKPVAALLSAPAAGADGTSRASSPHLTLAPPAASGGLPSILQPPFARVVALGVQVTVETGVSLSSASAAAATFALSDPRVPLPLHHPFTVTSKVLARRPRGGAASAPPPPDAAASRRTSISTASDVASVAYAASFSVAVGAGGPGGFAQAAGAAVAAAASLSLSRRVTDLLHSAHPSAAPLSGGQSLSPRSAAGAGGPIGRGVSSASAPAGSVSGLNDSLASSLSPVSDGGGGGGATDGAGAVAASSDAASVAGTGTVIDDEADSAHVLLEGGGSGGTLAVRLRTFGGAGYHDAPVAAAAQAGQQQRWPPAHPASPGGGVDDDGSASRGSGSSDDGEGSESSDDDDGGDASGGSVYVQHSLRCYVPLPLALSAYALAPPLTSGWAVEVDGSRALLGRVLTPTQLLPGLDGTLPAYAPAPTVLAFAHKFRRTISASNAIAAKLSLTFACAPPGTRGPLQRLDAAAHHRAPPPPVGTLAAAVADAVTAAAAAAYDGSGDDALAAATAAPPLPSFTYAEEVSLACAPSEALTETQLYGVMGMRR